mmetsp:Transcript_55391/g.177721  ORF Transcript_55391/g.177721 Transcript_55391/m.177721 type:complete len:293 (+) Transcript_55391:594-1472(+)
MVGSLLRTARKRMVAPEGSLKGNRRPGYHATKSGLWASTLLPSRPSLKRIRRCSSRPRPGSAPSPRSLLRGTITWRPRGRRSFARRWKLALARCGSSCSRGRSAWPRTPSRRGSGPRRRRARRGRRRQGKRSSRPRSSRGPTRRRWTAWRTPRGPRPRWHQWASKRAAAAHRSYVCPRRSRCRCWMPCWLWRAPRASTTPCGRRRSARSSTPTGATRSRASHRPRATSSRRGRRRARGWPQSEARARCVARRRARTCSTLGASRPPVGRSGPARAPVHSWRHRPHSAATTSV